MSFNLNTRNVEGVAVMDVSGRIVLGESANILRDAVSAMLDAGQRMILINLASVPYIDSSGLGVLVWALTRVTSQQGELKLLNTSTRVRDVLLVTKLYSVFDVHDDEGAAIRSFK